jgi:hypothetical protein
MSRMIRKQIYLEAAQDALLKQRAQELGVSEAALIRRCLESLEQPVLPLERHAWKDERAFLQRRLQTVPSQGGLRKRTWTREELYADRGTGLSR